MGTESENDCGAFHPWFGPLCSCFCLGRALLAGLLHDSGTTEYSIWVPLRVPPRPAEPATAVAAAADDDTEDPQASAPPRADAAQARAETEMVWPLAVV